MKTIGVKLRMETTEFVADANNAARATDQLRGKLEDAGVKGKQNLDALTGAMNKIGLGLVGVAAAAVYTNLQFDKQMSEVGAVANATAGQLGQLRDAAIEAGQATVFSAKDAAKAEAELAKAGVSTADILGGALTGSLSLASAGSLDLADSATIAASAMNTFGLHGQDVGHVADVLSAAANKSAASVDDLGLGLQQVGLVANQVGFSFEETVALLGAFADRGLRGSDGATSLKTALLRLAAPTDAAATELKKYGISLYDSTGATVSAATVAGQLRSAFQDLAPAQRNAALQTIFGSDAIRAANVLYSEGAAGIQDYVNAVDDQGAASRVAAAKMDNLAGDVEQLKGSLETLFITSGEGASGGLRSLAKGATELVNVFSSLPGPVQSSAIVVAGVGGAMLLAASAGLKLRARLGEVNAELVATGPAGAKAAAGLSLVGRAMGAVGVAGVIVTVLSLLTDLANSFDTVTYSSDKFATSLEELGRTGKATGEVAAVFGDDLSGIADALKSTENPFSGTLKIFEKWIPGLKQLNRDLLAGSPTAFLEQLQAVDDQLATQASSGHAAEAAASFKKIWEAAQTYGVSLDTLQAAFPAYIKAAADAAKATDVQTAAAKATADENIRLGGAFGEAANQADGLKAAFDSLNGVELTWRKSERDAEAAIDDLQEKLKASNGSLDAHGEKGRAAAAAVDALAESAGAAAQAKYNETKSVDEANKTYQAYIQQLRDILLQSGHSKDEVDKLIASIAAMPTYKAINIDVITHEKGYQDYRQGERSSTGRRWGGITTHAATGALREAATFTPQSPARYAFAEPATRGEAFVPRQGNYGRSMKILAAAAGWYNADVVPRQRWYGGGGGQSQTVNLDVKLIDPTTGATTRRALILDATNRGVPAEKIKEAHP